MAGNLINQYLWLINTLQKGPIPHEEISRKWEDSIFNDNPGKGLPKKTFHNHCAKIAEIFGVDIECEKKYPYGYYLGEPAEADAWKMDILNPLLIQAAIKDNPSLAYKVKNLDHVDNKNLPFIIECIQKQNVISFIKPERRVHLKYYKGTLADYWRECIKNGKQYSDFLVLSAVEISLRWWVIGAFVECNKPFEQWELGVFCLDHMKEVKVQYEDKTISTNSFNLQDYLENYKFDKIDLNDDRFLFGKYLSTNKKEVMYARRIF